MTSAAGPEASTAPADILDTASAGPAAIRGGVLRTVGYIAGILLSLASAPLLVRHLGIVEFGRYATVLSLVTIVAGVTEGGIVAIGLREYAQQTEPARSALMRNLLGLRLLTTLAGALVAVAFAAAVGYDHVLVVGTAIAGAGVVAQVVQGLLSIPLQAQLRFGTLTALDLVRQVASVGAIVALVALGAKLLPFLAVTLAAGLVALILTAVAVHGSIPFLPAFELPAWRVLLRDTLPFAAAIALGAIYFRVTIIVMSLVGTPAETGYFATSYRFLEVLVVIPNIVMAAVFPIMARAARDDRGRLGYALQRVFDVVFVGGVWIALCTSIGAGFAIAVIAGDAGEPAVAVLRIQACALVGTFVAGAASYGLVALRRYRVLILSGAAALLASTALNFALDSWLGARGAAGIVVATELGLGVALTFALRRHVPEFALSAGLLPRVLGAAALALLVVLLPIADVFRALLATTVYFGVLAATGGLPADVIAAMLRRGAR